MTNKIQSYHFIGIGGVGMSALARILLNKNIKISGSDITSSSVTDALSMSGATIHIGHSASHVHPNTTVVYSTDIKPDNPEYIAAKSLNCPFIHRSELLNIIMESYKSFAIAGTHGKTSTTSLLTWVLESAGLSPSYAIGGIVPQLSSNAGQGNGNYFVAEACESDRTFLNYHPFGAIVTNIDFDHMENYESKDAYINAFSQFMSQVKSKDHLFFCGDDKHLFAINQPGISYGFGDHCTLKASSYRQKGWSIFFDISYKGACYKDVEVSLTGLHNAKNALAVFGLALSLGIPESEIRKALKTFKGVLRRCERKGDLNGIDFYDDYGHHPTEIKATIKAIRSAIGERRLVVIYQPHRFSRAKECIGQYKDVFSETDALFITEIYAAREEPIAGVSHELIINEVKNDLGARCEHIARENAASILSTFLKPHDVCVTLGAGDITKLASEIQYLLAKLPPRKIKVGLIFGGVSVEHEVSLRSMEYVLLSLNEKIYDVELFCISRTGHWFAGPDAKERLLKNEKDNSPLKITQEVMEKLSGCDIIFPVLHGTNGEDGTMQGFLQILGKAYVGCNPIASANCMDKAITKRLAGLASIETSPFIAFSFHEWKMSQEKIIASINASLTYPLFVKPTHLGSSIGVHKALDESSLIAAINDAFRFDVEVLVENGIVGREIEFAVHGNDILTTYPPGEICARGKVYDYDNKYGDQGIPAIPKAILSEDLISKGMSLALRSYKALGCQGMARVDTFLDETGKFWLNEINPIPGFTKISLYPQMCEVNGLKGSDLIDRLIILGLERQRRLESLEMKP